MTTTQPLETEPEMSAAPADKDRRPGRFRIRPILPERLRPTRGLPPVWLEILFIAGSYYLYTLTRLAAPAHEGAAQNRGHDILNLEHYLGLNFEHTVNHWVWQVRWLAFGMNVYYATLHFIVPIVVLIWVYLRHPDRYRAVRTVMFAMTGLALIGFYFYSLAPPRLLDGAHFTDTFRLLNPWGQTATTSDGVAGISATNEYAAMPSLHIGWSTWCALAIAHLAERRWVKVLGILYPFATFAVIIGTANHYVLDAVGGLVVLGAGFLVQRLLLGRPVYAPLPPEDTDGTGGPAGPARSQDDPADSTDSSDNSEKQDSSRRKPGLPQQPFPARDSPRIPV